MIRLHRLLDNPLVIRELIERLGGGRLALGIFLATLLQSTAVVIAFSAFLYGGAGQSGLSLGVFIYMFWGVAIVVFVVFSAPVRAYGIFDWERRSESLDQHVTTGSSPLVALRGKLAICGVYALEIALASLPLGLYPVFLGDVPLWWVIEQLLVAMSFGFMLVGLFFWGCTIEAERSVGVAVFLLGAAVVCISPLILGDVAPLRVLTPFYAVFSHGAVPARQSYGGSIDATTYLFGHAIGQSGLLTIAIYTLVGGLGVLVAVAGPQRVHGAEASTFGTLISDSGRRWRRWRGTGMSRRRADLAFLYENRVPWFRKYLDHLHELQKFLFGALTLLLLFGLLWSAPSGTLSVSELSATLLLASGFYTVAVAARGATTREELLVPGRFARSRVAYLGLCLTLPLPLVVYLIGEQVGVTRTTPLPVETGGMLSLILCHGFILLLVGRNASRHGRTRGRGWLFQLLTGFLFYIGAPMAFRMGTAKGLLSTDMSWLDSLSPPLLAQALDSGRGLRYRVPGLDGLAQVFRSHPVDLDEALLLAVAITVVLGLLMTISERRQARLRRADSKPTTAALAVAVALCAGVVHAETPKDRPEVSIAVGFDGIVPSPWRWPLLVEVKCGSEPFRGRLEVGFLDAGDIWLAERLELAPGELRRFRRVASPSPASMYGQRGGLVETRLVSEAGEEVGQTPAQVAQPGGSIALLLVDGERADPSPAGSGPVQLGRGRGGAQRPEFRAVPPRLLPASSGAYLGVSAVVLGRAGRDPLEEEQLAALAAYALAGGTLVLTPATPPAVRARLAPPALAGVITDLVSRRGLRSTLLDCLDAEPEVRSFDGWDLSPLVAAGAHPVLTDRGGTGEPAHLAVGYAVGRGEIVMLAFDPWIAPFAGSRAIEAMERTLSASPSYWSGTIPSDRLETLRNTGNGMLLVVLLAISVPLVTAVLPWLVARYRRRPVSTWLLAPIGALLAMLIVALFALVGSSTLAVVDTITWWPRDGELAVARTEASLSSRGAQLDKLRLPGAWDDVTSIATSGYFGWRPVACSALREADGQATAVGGIGLGRWQGRAVVGVGPRTGTPAPRATLLVRALDGKGITGELEVTGLSSRIEDVAVVTPFSAGIVAAAIEPGAQPLLIAGTGREFERGYSWGAGESRGTVAILDGLLQTQLLSPGAESRLLATVPRAVPDVLADQGGLQELDGIDIVSMPLRVKVAPGAQLAVRPLNSKIGFLGSWPVAAGIIEGAEDEVAIAHFFNAVVPVPLEPGDFEVGSVTLPGGMLDELFQFSTQGTGELLQILDLSTGLWVDLLRGRDLSARQLAAIRLSDAQLRSCIDLGSGRILLRTVSPDDGSVVPWGGDQATRFATEVELRGAQK